MHLKDFLLGRYQVTLEERTVQAGFNQDLLARSSVHLEKIHVYLAEEVKEEEYVEWFGGTFLSLPLCVVDWRHLVLTWLY